MREDTLSGNSFHTSGSSPTRPCRVGLLGFGTVGSALARRLTSDPAATPFTLELTHIFDRRAHAKRDGFAATTALGSKIRWTTRVDDILTSDVDIVVEAIGGTDDAVGWTRAALLAGKSVVTCNKQAIAQHGPALLQLAARQGRQLRFEAAVGGAMPIVRAVGEGLAGDRVTSIAAILNGTTNAVLSRMEAQRCRLAQALADAQARGYAEADPSADLDGIDARAKLTILCALAFGLQVDPARIETHTAAGMTVQDFDAAALRGGTIRQLACAAYEPEASVLTAWVAPSVVPRGSLFARTTGPQNAAVITGAFAGEISLSGAGAGGGATAVAVISDLLAIARDRAAIVPAAKLSRPETVIGCTPTNAKTAASAEKPLLRAALRAPVTACVERGVVAEAV
ncbi:MAG: homoserine dehydrogenase [Acidobacteria bacterium]|nr:homoserine dehydrogenase [Acidobacteriota bacterium]